MQCNCLLVFAVRVQTSDPTMTFRGIVMQARQSTPTFSNDASFVGSFTMPPAEGDWRIWSCAAVRSNYTVKDYGLSLVTSFEIRKQNQTSICPLFLGDGLWTSMCDKQEDTLVTSIQVFFHL